MPGRRPVLDRAGGGGWKHMPDASGAAARLADAASAVLGVPELPVRVRAWDGSTAGPPDAPAIVVHTPRALRRLLWAPGELGLGRAYVTGEIEIEGDVFETFAALSAGGLLSESATPHRTRARDWLR